MSLPWSAQQREWLREMGFDVLEQRGTEEAATGSGATAAPEVSRRDTTGPSRASDAAPAGLPPWLRRIARGVDLAPVLASAGIPRDPTARRAFWRALRPLRKAARGP